MHDLIFENQSDLDFLIYGGVLELRDGLSPCERTRCGADFDYGVGKGDRVFIAMRNYPEWVISLFAITSIGAIAVPVNAWWNQMNSTLACPTVSRELLLLTKRE